MLKKYLINVSIVFVTGGLVILFQFVGRDEGVSATEALANLSDRAGILGAFWIGGSLVGGAALMVFHLFGDASEK